LIGCCFYPNIEGHSSEAYSKYQNRARDKLAEKMASFREERLWMRAENSRSGRLAGRDGANLMALELIERVDVVGVYDAGGVESAEELCE
jgi:hypothetical protein